MSALEGLHHVTAGCRDELERRLTPITNPRTAGAA